MFSGGLTGRAEHSVNLGVCNVTNQFNPFMPNFSWRVTF